MSGVRKSVRRKLKLNTKYGHNNFTRNIWFFSFSVIFSIVFTCSHNIEIKHLINTFNLQTWTCKFQFQRIRIWVLCPNLVIGYALTLIKTWSQINVISGLNICEMVRETERKVDLSHFSSFNIVSYFISTDLIGSLLDPRLIDLGSNLIHLVHTTHSILMQSRA